VTYMLLFFLDFGMLASALPVKTVDIAGTAMM